MSARAYDALLLDLDGTLVDDRGQVHPRTRAALHEAHNRGVLVMVVTGRSEGGARPVLDGLGLGTPAVVYNGAGLWCTKSQRLLEERILSNQAVARALDFARSGEHSVVVMRSGEKFALPARDALEERALQGMAGLKVVPFDELPREYVIRITLFSHSHSSAKDCAQSLEAHVDLPLYLTWFPLNHLADHRDSPLQVVDIHPPCRGKGEALRIVEELYGIPASRVVAVGDASNDVPMFERAGLPVAMAVSMPEARAAAQRVIGDNNSATIAELVEELFLRGD